jgi:hypothetical protein
MSAQCDHETSILDRLYFISQIFRYQIEQGGAQLNDLLMRKAFALQLTVKALRHGLVSVQVQFFGMFVGHFLVRVGDFYAVLYSKCRATYIYQAFIGTYAIVST